MLRGLVQSAGRAFVVPVAELTGGTDGDARLADENLRQTEDAEYLAVDICHRLPSLFGLRRFASGVEGSRMRKWNLLLEIRTENFFLVPSIGIHCCGFDLAACSAS